MEVGMSVVFQTQGYGLTDQQVIQHELEIAKEAEAQGFDSIWATEHHFTGYEMTPSPVQFLTYMAGVTTKLKLGTMAIIVAWHDPYRVAIEVSTLDNFSCGRAILGLGRGSSALEFDRFRVPVEESRQRFAEHTEAILESLETGTFEIDGTFIKQKSSPLRPTPIETFQGRTYIAGASPEAMDYAAKVGAGLLAIPSTGWDEMVANVNLYNEAWDKHRPGEPRPRPLVVGFVYVDKDRERAREIALKHMGDFYRGTIDHYAMVPEGEGRQAKIDAMVNSFAEQMIWGTPEDVLAKITDLRARTGAGTFISHFTYAGLPWEDAKSSIDLFVKEIMPTLHSWDDTGLVQTALPATATA